VFQQQTATRIKLGFGFRVPAGYTGTTATITLYWYATVTSGKIVWEIDYTAIASSETTDPSSNQQSTTSTGVTVDGTARDLSVTAISLTAANFTAGDWVQGAIVRDGADTTNDTAAGSGFLVHAEFNWV
jgi:hypothetical protein